MINQILKRAHHSSASICNAIDGARVLVTGASGLIGLNFIAALLRIKSLGYNLSIDAIMGTKRDALAGSLREQGVLVRHIDLSDINMPIMQEKYDVILHAASYGQPGKFMSNKLATINLNSTALVKLSSQLEPGGRILSISTSELYSGNTKLVHVEDEIGTTTPQHARACYIEAKRVGETICEILNEHGYKAYSARLALGYGPGVWLDDQRVLNQFILKALVNNKINLLDGGDAIRTYGFVSDIVEMLLNIILFGNSTLYNVGGKSVTTIKDLAITIADMIGVKVSFGESDGGLKDAPKSVELDLSRYEIEFNKTSYVPLRDGLLSTIDWYKYLLKGYV